MTMPEPPRVVALTVPPLGLRVTPKTVEISITGSCAPIQRDAQHAMPDKA